MQLRQDDPEADWTVPGGAGDPIRELGAAPSRHDVSDWDDPGDWFGAPEEIPFATGNWQLHATPGHHLDVLVHAGRLLSRTEADGVVYHTRG